MGWFSGKASELHPLPYSEEAAMWADLAGGADKLFDKLKESYEKERYQWAIQLADALLEIKKFEKEAKVPSVKLFHLLFLSKSVNHIPS